ncbi:cytochrome c [Paenibacillus sp. HB172176]|uniref:c-type cytochrome n=1 Tax=Paenibacillus sp. HB172176 TaxID=2493690 RepID=UPI001F0E9A42|nr:cytochrome c [Paenibacillus sp. HB172176]
MPSENQEPKESAKGSPSRRSLLKFSIPIILLILVLGYMLLANGGDGNSGGENGENIQTTDPGSGLKDAPAAVAALYKAQCISCHGTELQGRVGASTNLQHVGARMDEAAITKQIQNGGGVMPAFKKSLTDEEINSLAAWLATKK